MRESQVLRDDWWVRKLERPDPDVVMLSEALRAPDDTWLSATMPAQVHDVLLAHGRIPDPRIGKNAAESAWVGEADWAYGRVFTSPQGDGPVFLRFSGLDTLATVYVNGTEVGRFANMHRHYAVEVRAALTPPGEDNVLLIVFASPLRFAASVKPVEGIASHHHLRKCKSDFSSYLGARPHSAKVGIFDDVVLDVPDAAWLEDAWVRPVLSDDLASAGIHVALSVQGAPTPLAWTLLDPAGAVVVQGEAQAGEDTWTISIGDPILWWPRSHGEPHLYALHLALGDPMGTYDRRVISFGIRNVTPVLDDPQTGDERFAFEVNGEMVFLRGACWAPLQGMTHCWDQTRADVLFDLVEHGEMNVLRVWGGGLVPPEAFYQACDRRGILVWQDFMFGYSMHPDDDPAFVAECRAEVEDVVRRLRNHPSILLWCGGNENHMGWDFTFGTAPDFGQVLFGGVMPEVCAELDPDRFFHPSSPHGGPVPNWPLSGDWHDYTTLTFSPEASVPLFASEIGRVSAPSIHSMRAFLSEDELWPESHDPRIRVPGEAAWPPMWQYRSVDGSWDKIGAIEAYCDPVSAGDLIRALGTAHGEYLYDRVARHRRGLPDGALVDEGALADEGAFADDRPLTDEEGAIGVLAGMQRRCWGTTIWRLNDPWPILYWSVVDAYNEPKIPYYFLRRAYAPVLVSFERTPDEIAAWVVNDGPVPVTGTLTVRHARFSGKVRAELQVEVALQPGEARRCMDVTPFGPINLRSEFLWATLATPTTTYAASFLLMGERYLHLPRATLTVRPAPGGVEVSTDVFARQVSLMMEDATGAVFEDNFFDLVPGQSRTIAVLRDGGATELRIAAVNAPATTLDWWGLAT